MHVVHEVVSREGEEPGDECQQRDGCHQVARGIPAGLGAYGELDVAAGKFLRVTGRNADTARDAIIEPLNACADERSRGAARRLDL